MRNLVSNARNIARMGDLASFCKVPMKQIPNAITFCHCVRGDCRHEKCEVDDVKWKIGGSTALEELV